MNTCDTCKHWRQIENAPPGSYGDCTALGNAESCPVDSAYIPEACDRYGYRLQPELITGPKFGCVNWQLVPNSSWLSFPDVAYAVRCQCCGFLNQLSKPVPRSEYATTKTPCQRPGCGAVQQAICGEWRKEGDK